jgi:hypothetical protein
MSHDGNKQAEGKSEKDKESVEKKAGQRAVREAFVGRMKSCPSADQIRNHESTYSDYVTGFHSAKDSLNKLLKNNPTAEKEMMQERY